MHGLVLRRRVENLLMKCGDRLEELLARAQAEPEILEVVVGQFGQDLAVDLVLSEKIDKAAKTVGLKPTCYIIHGPCLADVSGSGNLEP